MKNKSVWILVILACFSYVTYCLISDNLDKIFALRADYYLNKNDIKNAQNFYERAFSLGFSEEAQREAYVNSIINSPLTTESQEKLVKFLENPIEDSAKLKVKYFLYDLKREIHRKYPYNYITNAVHNQRVMRWNSMPVKYSFVKNGDVPRYFVREIENAFTELEQVTENQILFEENDESPNIIIKLEPYNPVEDKLQKYVVAYTTPITNLNKLKNMEVVFYLRDAQGEYFSQNQVYNTALHEIIHALGFMGHSSDKNNIMYLTKDSASLVDDEREKLSEADINTLKLLYKIKPQITNTEIGQSEYIPYLVFGTEQEVNNEKISEALIYIRKAPNLPAGYIDLAEGYVQAKDYNKAIKSLKKALYLADTEDIKGMIYFNLAVTHYYSNYLEQAQKYLEKSIQISDSEEKQYFLCEINLKNNDKQSAIIGYKNLINKNPQNIEYVIALANVYVLDKDYVEAREILHNFIKHNPKEKNNPRLKSYGILKLGL